MTDSRPLHNEPSPLEVKVLTRLFSVPNSQSIDTYLAHDGYKALEAFERLRLKCSVGAGDDGGEIDSVTAVWAGADWYEREVYDLFGVRFRNHPDMTRIMMPDDWVGYPLRKDYPVHGHKYSYQSE